ncbi:addiction module protein [Limnohabitans sp. 2KL-3]|uniref:addiction module protein n=1 Tax=Limnohabitans sp. 2KL-3 TaxID=1100700 RepID=UPI000A40148C|nr:addiction module protein [Limnohabitans sp. 2KL-3]
MTSVNRVSDPSNERNLSLDEQWAQEADSRLAAYHRGEVQAIPLNEVMAQYLVKLAWVKIPK